GLLLARHGPLRALAGPRVGTGPLAADRQATPVTDALIGADLHLAPDVRGDLAAQVTFKLVVALQEIPEPDELLIGQVTSPLVWVDACGRESLLGAGPADPEDVGERDLHPLVAGEVDTD